MKPYPINLMLQGKTCVVIGGGKVAERKIRSLLECGGKVVVISPALTPGLLELDSQHAIFYQQRSYEPGTLPSGLLLLCATDDRDVNRSAAEEGKEKGMLVNVVDAPELCDFTLPAQICRQDLLLTVSTGGKSPAVAGQIKRELEEKYGEEYGEYLVLIGEFRRRIREALPHSRDREAFWNREMTEKILFLLRNGRRKDAEELICHGSDCNWTES